jgi:hypothetical protein
MFDVTLFIGVEISDDLKRALAAANPAAIDIFINNGSEYLQEATLSGVHYLGKIIEAPAGLETCSLVASNVETLLQKIIPTFSSKIDQLRLIATLKEPEVIKK